MSVRDFINEDEKICNNFDEIISEQLTGAEIAKEMGITRQAVSNTLKRAMKKMFNEFQKIDKSWDAFEVAVAMAQGFGDLTNDEVEMKKFFRLFPPDLKRKIEKDAEKRFSKAKE